MSNDKVLCNIGDLLVHEENIGLIIDIKFTSKNKNSLYRSGNYYVIEWIQKNKHGEKTYITSYKEMIAVQNLDQAILYSTYTHYQARKENG